MSAGKPAKRSRNGQRADERPVTAWSARFGVAATCTNGAFLVFFGPFRHLKDLNLYFKLYFKPIYFKTEPLEKRRREMGHE